MPAEGWCGPVRWASVTTAGRPAYRGRARALDGAPGTRAGRGSRASSAPAGGPAGGVRTRPGPGAGRRPFSRAISRPFHAAMLTNYRGLTEPGADDGEVSD